MILKYVAVCCASLSAVALLLRSPTTVNHRCPTPASSHFFSPRFSLSLIFALLLRPLFPSLSLSFPLFPSLSLSFPLFPSDQVRHQLVPEFAQTHAVPNPNGGPSILPPSVYQLRAWCDDYLQKQGRIDLPDGHLLTLKAQTLSANTHNT